MAPMKAMKAMKAGSALTQTAAYAAVAEKVGLKSKEVKAAVEGLLDVAAEQMKKNGSFKFGGVLNMKLRSKAASKARKGINPFTKEPCVIKAKLASWGMCVLAMKKVKEMVN